MPLRTVVTLLVGTVGLVACSETSINSGSFVLEPPNPPDLEVPLQVDRTVQTPVPAVDVLWVIDNSRSMAEEQRALGANFGSFINYFVGSGLDYHVGVVSTGFDDAGDRGKLRSSGSHKWIDEDTRDPTGVFRDIAVMGTDGPADEKGRDQVYGAIELLGRDAGSPNAGFYRDDAALSVIVISDEDDASRVTTVNEFVDWMVGLKERPEQVSFSSIVGPPGGCDGRGGTAVEGKDYLRITAEVGGIAWPICDDNWSQVLEDLGIQVAGLQREFYLSAVPVEDSIEVWVETEEGRDDYDREVDWTYSRSRNSVKFNTLVPDPYAEVFVSYEPLSASQAAEDEQVDSSD